tara:strand:+ start:6924 stop:8162 length:1239 start_codon:yes stop_codon:yes gene_type:complete
MVDTFNDGYVMRAGMLVPAGMPGVQPQSSFIPKPQDKTPDPNFKGVKPMASRMSLAYDRLTSRITQEKEKGLEPKTAQALGKLLLEIEIVNSNLQNISASVRNQTKAQRQLNDEEKKLLEEEEDSLLGLRAGFNDLRTKIGGFSALLAGKQFLEGNFEAGAQSAALAVTSFLPEIINVVSGVVLGRVLGGGARTIAGGPAGRGRGGLLAALLLGGGLVAGGQAMANPGGNADQRRTELVDSGSSLTAKDVNRFRSLTSRFNNILTGQKKGFDATKKEDLKAAAPPELEIPKGPVEYAGDILNNLGIDRKLLEGDAFVQKQVDVATAENNIEVVEAPVIESFSLDLPDDNFAPITFTSEGAQQPNIINVPGKTITPQTSTSKDGPRSYSINLNSEFSDNSKIPYRLIYGGSYR